MKATKILMIAVMGLMLASASKVRSQNSDRLVFDPSAALFTANELSLDLFGYHASRNKDGSNTDAWGPGLGVNYFITEFVGVGADTYADAFELPYLINGSAIFRYPILTAGLAPYAFLGVGRQWEHAAQWTGHFGGGVEYRFNPRTGFFVDVRRVFAAETADYTVVRFGFRLAF